MSIALVFRGGLFVPFFGAGKKVITGIKGGKYDKAYKKGFVQEFFATPDVRWWMKGYRIEVTLPKGTRVFKDNGATPIPGLADGMRIEFPVAKELSHPARPVEQSARAGATADLLNHLPSLSVGLVSSLSSGRWRWILVVRSLIIMTTLIQAAVEN